MALYQFSRKYAFELMVDFSHHPLSGYLERVDVVPVDSEHEVHEFFNHDIKKLEPFLAGLKANDIRFVTTHAVPSGLIDLECSGFLRKRITCTDRIGNRVRDVIAELDLNAFCVMHMRMGDHTFGIDIPRVPVIEVCLRELLIPEWGRNIVVMSDNSAIKKFIAAEFDLKYLENTPVHLGQCAVKDVPGDGVLDAILEFNLMARAEKIYQYSVYPWGSSFSEMCSRIYSVPLIRIISQEQ